MRRRISIYRRWRSSPFGYEWYSHEGIRWLHIWWGHPRRHTWWAMSVYFYVTY